MSNDTLSRPLAQRLANVHVAPLHTTSEPDISLNVIQAASDALDRGETHYADRPGIPELRALVAQRLNAAYALTLDGNTVTICCGSTEPRFSALQVLVKPGSTVVAPRDAERIAATVALIGAELVADAEGSALLYLTPGEDVEAWLDKAEANGWWIIWDISGAPAPATHPAQRPTLTARVLTIDDMETDMPGWAIGWMAGSEKHAEIRAFKQAMTICATNVSQWAVLEFLKDKS